MKRDTAEFERGAAARAQRLEQLLQAREQRIEPCELIASRHDRRHRLAHDRFAHARMGDEHVEHCDLRQVRVEAADLALAHHGTAIIRDRRHHPLELARAVGQHPQRDALRELGHDRVGNGALELGVDLARRQGGGAGGEIEIGRQEVGKAHAERAEKAVGVLHHAARAQPHRDPAAAQIGERPDRRLRPHHEEQRAGIHRRRHGERERAGERCLAALRAADPVRRHEAELDLARVQAKGVLRAGGIGFQNLDGRQGRPPLQHRLERLSLGVEGPVALGGADPDHRGCS
jgi:hypothetical protein